MRKVREHDQDVNSLIKVIFLERQSSVEMQASIVKQERDERLQALNTIVVGERARLDVPQLMQGLNEHDRIWKEYARWAAENLELPNVLKLTYDQLRDSPQETVNRVFDHLGVTRLSVDLTAATGKLTAGCVHEALSNPDEVAFALVGTKWEGEVDPCSPSPPQPPSPPPSPPWAPPKLDNVKWLNARSVKPSPSPEPLEAVTVTEQVREVFARAKDQRRKEVSGALAELAEARAQFARAEQHLAQARTGEQLLKEKQIEAFGAPVVQQQQEQLVTYSKPSR